MFQCTWNYWSVLLHEFCNTHYVYEFQHLSRGKDGYYYTEDKGERETLPWDSLS